MKPLEGILVIELGSSLAGAFGTQLLAGLGAEVIMVEAPEGGNPCRSVPPHPGGDGEKARESIDGISFLKGARCKKSVTLNLEKEEGKKLLLRLVKRADAVVDSFDFEYSESLKLGYHDLRAANLRVVYCTVRPFGSFGPLKSRPATELTVQAMSGAMLGSGLVHAVESGGVPYRCGVDASMLTASLNMAIGLLAALERREVSGEGQWVDVSMHDSLLAIKAILRPEIEGGAIRAPFGIFKTCDGHIVICVSRDKQWTGLAGAMGREELSSDPRFIGMGDRCANVRELNGIIQEWLTGKTGEQALQILRKAMVPASLIMNIGELLQDNHLNHRGMVTDLFSTSGEKIEGVKSYGLPIKLSRSPGAFDYPAPAVGAQTGEIFNTLLGITKAELERLRNEGLV